MDMRCLKESVLMDWHIGAGRSEAVVNGEITLPGGLREEARVLHAGAMAVIDSAEAMQDRLTLTGRVIFHTLYTQGDPDRIQAIEATADFSHMMDLPGAARNMTCTPDCAVAHVSATVINGRLALHAALQCHADVLSQQPIEALTGLDGVDGLEIRMCERQYRRTVARGTADTLLREEFALPASLEIRDTLFATARLQSCEISGGAGRAGVNGTLQLEVCHACSLPGKPLVITRHTVPFEHTVDLAGETGDSLSARVMVRDVAVASQETADGERTLRAEVQLRTHAVSNRDERMTLLEDAYTTAGDNLVLTSTPVHYRTGDTALQTAESGKMMLMLPEGSPPVHTVLCAYATPQLTGSEQAGGRLTVEGSMDVNLLYMTNDSATPVSVRLSEPFRLMFTATAADDHLLQLTASDLEATPVTSDRVELKYIMHLNAKGTEEQTAQLITAAERIPAAEPDAGIILYFAQAGDDIWHIAQRYRIPAARLKELNPGISDPISAGQGVIVWRKA